MKKLLFGVLFASMGFGANIAMADGWPVSVVGTWSVLANQSAGTLSITSQGATGNCRSITGTILGKPIVGFYCPFSGHPLPAQFWRNYIRGLHREFIAGGAGTPHGRSISISKARAGFLSKWLERSPPMSYPRPWRGKLARIKGVDGLRPNPYRRALPMHWLFPT
jgi:hypothetical protein